MIKRKPTVLKTEIGNDGHSAILTLSVDADISDFSGHFNHFPLLPGVTQIDWAIHYAVTLLHVPAAFKSMEVVKFQKPIFPDDLVTLILTWDDKKQKLSYRYLSQNPGDAEPMALSSGKIKLRSVR
ncbi:3-hydroxyacyl-ACP dehydratase [Vibrio sp. PP-XX7]